MLNFLTQKIIFITKMKKIITVVALSFFLFACGNGTVTEVKTDSTSVDTVKVDTVKTITKSDSCVKNCEKK